MNLNYIESEHLPELLRLNNLAVPHVNQLTLQELDELVKEAEFAQLVADEYAIAGFMLAFDKAANYEGFNFNWFKQRFDNFLYIDRIVVNAAYRGQGVGKSMYQELEAYCKENGIASMTCEVNLEPENPVSHQFHQELGFEALEAVLHPEGKRVQMYQKVL